ncbi:MAG: tetratricopeptide repeat protein [Acidobacteriota bacterium]|nr:tetratricopeptide repeat protein [Acidobacteriota bacterium]
MSSYRTGESWRTDCTSRSRKPKLVQGLTTTGRLCATLVMLLLSASRSAQTAQTPEVSLEQAMDVLRGGEIARAIELFEELAQQPQPPLPALGILGGLYVERGDGELAMPLLQRVIEADAANPAVLFNAGRAALLTGDPRAGARYLEQAAAMAPGSPAARALGLLRGQQGLPEEAYVLLRPWVRDNPDDHEARLAAALGAVELRRVPEAEELLAGLSQQDPGVQLLWGRLLLLKGEPWGAIGFLRPLVDSPPETVARDSRRLLADAFLTVGDSAEAIAVLEAGHLQGPRSFLLLSQAYYRNGNPEQAVATLQELADAALPRESEMADEVRAKLLLTHGLHLIGVSKHAQALLYLERAVALDPTNKVGWQNLGQALSAGGRRDEAKLAAERFHEIADAEQEPSINQAQRDLEDPTGRELREAMQMLYAGDAEGAQARLLREVKLAPGDPRPLLYLSRVYLLDGRASEALEAADSALAAAPENPDALYSVATAQMGLGQIAAAEAGLASLLAKTPDYTPAMNDLAVLLIQSGRGNEARPLLERVLQIRPEDPLAARNLELLAGDH